MSAVEEDTPLAAETPRRVDEEATEWHVAPLEPCDDWTQPVNVAAAQTDKYANMREMAKSLGDPQAAPVINGKGDGLFDIRFPGEQGGLETRWQNHGGGGGLRFEAGVFYSAGRGDGIGWRRGGG